MVTELELTEYEENERARFVTDAGGTVWDTVFSFQPTGAATKLVIELEARPHRFLSKLMYPLIKRMVRKGMETHIGALTSYCEKQAKTET